MAAGHPGAGALPVAEGRREGAVHHTEEHPGADPLAVVPSHYRAAAVGAADTAAASRRPLEGAEEPTAVGQGVGWPLQMVPSHLDPRSHLLCRGRTSLAHPTEKLLDQPPL